MRMNFKTKKVLNKRSTNKFIYPIYGFFRQNFAVLAGFILISVFFTVMSNKFLSFDNIMSVLRQISTNALLAFGMAFVMITGGIDLSVGSMVAIAGTFTVGMCVSGMPIPAAILLSVGLCTLLGAISGIVISKSGMPAFIVTMAMMQMGRGVAYIYTGGQPIHFNNETYNYLGNGYVGVIPFPVIVMIVVLMILNITLSKSRFGKYVYAIGGNREAARFSGVNIFRVEVVVYLISAMLSGIAGVILSARLYSAIPTVGDGFELDAIAATVLGGTSFTGGRGNMIGTMIGVMIIGVITNGLNLLKVPFYYQLILKGLIIVFAVYLDTVKRKRTGT